MRPNRTLQHPPSRGRRFRPPCPETPMPPPDEPSADEILRSTEVSMRYGRGPEVLNDVSLSLPRGSFHFVTGPSGAGKSSLLKLIYLAARPSSGAVQVFGEDVSLMTAKELPRLRRRIGVVFQDLLLLDHLSAFD